MIPALMCKWFGPNYKTIGAGAIGVIGAAVLAAPDLYKVQHPYLYSVFQGMQAAGFIGVMAARQHDNHTSVEKTPDPPK